MKNVKYNGGRVVADGSVKIRIRCVGYSQGSNHYADAVVVSATSLVLSIDGVADTSFSGASATLLFATYTTLGALIDQINSSANWEAEIVAGLRTDAVDGSELLARSTSTFIMYEEVKLYADSSDAGVYKVSFLLEPNRAFDFVHGLDSQQIYHQNRVGLMRHRSSVNTNSGEATAITAYELKPDKASALKTLGTWAGVDTTEKDSGQTDLPLFQADFGNSILIELSSTGWIDAAAYLDVQGMLEQSS